MGEARAAADVLAQVDVSALDVDAAARVGLAHAEALDLAGDLEGSVEALERLCARLMDAHRYLQAAYAAMRIVMALTEIADLHRAVARGEHLLAQLPASVAGSDEVVRLESTIIWAYIARGDATYARYRGRQLLAHTRQHGSARAVSSVHWNLAFVDDALGDPDAALAQLESAIALAGADEIDRDLPRLRLDRAFLLVSVEPPRAAGGARGPRRRADRARGRASHRSSSPVPTPSGRAPGCCSTTRRPPSSTPPARSSCCGRACAATRRPRTRRSATRCSPSGPGPRPSRSTGRRPSCST